MSKHPLCLVIGVLWFSAAAGAQPAAPQIHRPWEFSVFGGGSFVADHQYPTPVSGSGQATVQLVGMKFATGPQLGVRISENKWNNWGADLEYSFSNQPLAFTNLSPSLPYLSLSHSIHRFIYDVAYYPLGRSERLRPFGFAGAGASFFTIGDSSKLVIPAFDLRLADEWKFAFSWGGGVNYLVKDPVAFCFRFADNITGVPSYGLPRTARVVGGQYVPGFQPDGYLHNWLIQLAFVYQWGAK